MSKVLGFIANMIARLPWERVIWFIIRTLSKKMAEIWKAVWDCVNWIEDSMPDASGEEKRMAAWDCIKGALSSKGLQTKDSIINFFIEIAVQGLKVGLGG